MQSVQKQLYETQIKQKISQTLNVNNNIIDTIQFDPRDDFTLVRTSIRGDTAPSTAEIKKLNAQLIKDRKGHPSYLQIRFIPVQIIQTQPLKEIHLSDQEAQQLSITASN